MEEVQAHFSWPSATTVGVRVIVPAAFGIDEVTMMTPVPFVMVPRRPGVCHDRRAGGPAGDDQGLASSLDRIQAKASCTS